MKTRRTVLKMLAAAGATSLATAGRAASAPATPAMVTRRIPASEELLPVIGMGSSNTFDVGTDAASRAPLGEVLRSLVDGGSTAIDTSPMYGRAETVLGDLLQHLGLRDRTWLATKVWTRGREAGLRQIEQSFSRLRTTRLELLQIHNLLDWREHLPTLRTLVEQKKVRYTGITHYRADAHEELERVLRAERFDWVQVNYSLAEPEAADRLLPHCLDTGVAVMVNRPFADGALFNRVRGKPLPPWAAEVGCASWGQFFLRWAAAHPAVTCVIPATSNPRHVVDNCAAGHLPLPDERQRERMRAYWISV